MDIPIIKLKSGNSIPVLGLGTWQLTDGKCVEAVAKALGLGYRHIDTAEIYGNHREIGKAIRGFDRSKLFITSKVWTSDLSHDKALKACDKALEELGTGYLDLYLIHWPSGNVPFAETLSALNELMNTGKIKSIGVSNFTISHLEEALGSGIQISANQVEFHPRLYQKELLDFCKKNGIVVTAYSPLGRGNVIGDETIEGIARRHGKTAAQISLKWLLQKGVVVIPKASSESHLRENMGLFGWKLTKKDIADIDSMGMEKRIIDPFGTFGDKNVRQKIFSRFANI